MFGQINHLQKRPSGIYYAVFHIPIQLQPILSKKQVWKSLLTAHKKEAIERLASLKPRVYSFLNQLSQDTTMDRRKLNDVFLKFFEDLLIQQKETLVPYQRELHLLEGKKVFEQESFWDWMTEEKDFDLLHKKVQTLNDQIEHLKSKQNKILWNGKHYNPTQVREKLNSIREKISEGRLPFLQSVETILNENDVGTVASDDLKEANLLFVDLVKRWLNLAKDPDSILNMNTQNFKDLMFKETKQSSLHDSPYLPQTFKDLSAKWLKSTSTRHFSKNRRADVEKKLEKLNSLIGYQKNIVAIKKEEVERSLWLLRNMPAHKEKNFPNLTLHQAISKIKNDDEKKISLSTFHSYYSIFKSVMEWGFKSKYLPENITLFVELPKERNATEKYRPYSIPMLNKLFSYEGIVQENFARFFWIPLISLYSGMRLNEIGQLLTADIQEEDGIAYINVEALEQRGQTKKSLKTNSSHRKVPIHPQLIELGFLDYVQKTREMKKERLFYLNKKSVRGNYSGNCSKWYSRVLRDVGIKDKGICFHSFRHTFRDACRNCEVEKSKAIAIGGWTDQGVSEHYGQGYNLKVLSEAIEKIHYDGLDLSKVKERIKSST